MPRKCEKGILGYRKDPRHQVLFSFSPREGDQCPSSDSEDSDYLPSDEEKPTSSNRKTKERNQKKSKLTRNGKHPMKRPADSPLGEGDAKLSKLSGFQGRLPPELWLKIFQFVVQEDGALPFLCRAAKVCQMWNELSEHPSLWEVVDLSYGWIRSRDSTVKWLANNRLSQCHTLSISSWKNLTTDGVLEVAMNCSLLKSINLSYCKKLTSEGLEALVDECTNLEEIDISFTSNDAVTQGSLKHLATATGKRLRHLSVGGNTLRSFTVALYTIMSSCPNLELLDVSNAVFTGDFATLNIEKFQASCPKLRVLRLTNSKFRAPSASQRVKNESPGFPHLEQLSLAVSTSGMSSSVSFDNDFLSRLLKNTVDLKLLDLRGCTNLSTTSLLHAPATDLNQLHIAQSSLAKYPDLETVVKKWQHSLTHLDLSWNNCPENLDRAVLALTEDRQQSPLEHLSVAGTSVGITPIKSVLSCCPKLTYMNLASCRSLPRGVKREFTGRQNILELVEQFEDVSDSDLESLSD